MKLFDITIAGRRFSVAREPGEHNLCHQTYSVDGREVPVQRYLELIAVAAAGIAIHAT
jgi:hypothetical protein